MINLYQILSVNSICSQAAIKRAYREASLRWHPDRPDGDEARFKLVASAYQTLGDLTSRRRWEERRTQWLAARGAVDCSICWTPNRLRFHGVIQRCGNCNVRLPETTLTGRSIVLVPKLLQGKDDPSEGVIQAVIDRNDLLGADWSHELQVWLLSLLPKKL